MGRICSVCRGEPTVGSCMNCTVEKCDMRNDVLAVAPYLKTNLPEGIPGSVGGWGSISSSDCRLIKRPPYFDMCKNCDMSNCSARIGSYNESKPACTSSDKVPGCACETCTIMNCVRSGGKDMAKISKSFGGICETNNPGIGIGEASGVGIGEAGSLPTEVEVHHELDIPTISTPKVNILEETSNFNIRRAVIRNAVNNAVYYSFARIPEKDDPFIAEPNINCKALADELSRREPDRSIDSTRQMYIPIVIAINGAGGNGKDTFVKGCDQYISVSNLDSVALPKELCNIVCEQSEYFDGGVANDSWYAKDDKVRMLISDLKAAIIKFNNFPNRKIVSTITTKLCEAMESNRSHEHWPKIYFVHIREQAEIDDLKEMLREHNIICYSMLVSGLVDPSTYSNSSDALVETFDYDFYVDNDPGDVDGFKLKAHMFTMLMKKAIVDYGEIRKCNIR